jgi:hypothetical protein
MKEIDPPVFPEHLVRIRWIGESRELPSQPEPDGAPYYVGQYYERENKPVVRVWRSLAFYRLLYFHDCEFLISVAGDEIWCRWAAGTAPGLAGAYLYGPVLAFTLRLRGILALHASVVVSNGKALALLGPSGAGKSTLAAELIKQGCEACCDDIAALSWAASGDVLVQRGYPRLRLWPDSVEALYTQGYTLQPIELGFFPTTSSLAVSQKCYFAVGSQDPLRLSSPVLLAAIYAIDQSKDTPETQVTPLTGVHALAVLDAQCHSAYLLARQQRVRQLADLSRVADRVPIRLLEPAKGLPALGRLAASILIDFENLKAAIKAESNQ